VDLLLLISFIIGNMKLKLEKVAKTAYNVKTNHGIKLGEFYQEVDGFYVFLPVESSGFLSEEFLEALLFELQQLNALWKENIRNYFENESKNNKV